MLSIDRADSYFHLPAHAQLLAVTHVLELPRDLRIPDGRRLLAGRADEGALTLLEHEVVEQLLQTELDPAAPAPSIRLVFRRPHVRVRVPLLAADEAFARWDEELISRRGRRQRRRLVRRFRREGVTAPVTVVGATSFLDARQWPSEISAQEALLDGFLENAIDLLNDQIIALGLVSDHPHLAPVSIGDLPALCPVILEVAPAPGGRRIGRSFLRELHGDLPAFARAEPHDERVVAAAGELSRRQYLGAEPFFLFYELWLRARSALNSHRFAEAIAQVGTAVEVLISTVIREASTAHGEPNGRREGILEAPLRSQVEHHLGRYASLRVDLNDITNPIGAWWSGGYETRNRVVHSGHNPTDKEAEEAFNQASELAVAIRNGLLSKSVTRDLGATLEIGTREERDAFWGSDG